MTRHAEKADTADRPSAPVVLLPEDLWARREMALAFQRLGAVVTADESDAPDFVVSADLELDREGLRRRRSGSPAHSTS